MEFITITTRVCPVCGRTHTVNVREEDLIKFNSGLHVQDAFPYLTDDEREMLLTGIDSECWNKVFADDEEDE